MTLPEFKHLLEEFEADGRQALGVYLTKEQAVDLRWELYQLYGSDPGPHLTTLYGLGVLATDAPFLRFET
ncbi:MAG: hypothetical protein H7832_07665 [Magnetococcus sp. DMHC-6]